LRVLRVSWDPEATLASRVSPAAVVADGYAVTNIGLPLYLFRYNLEMLADLDLIRERFKAAEQAAKELES